MMRSDGREKLEIRQCTITRNYLKHAEGSVLIEMGDTKVLCCATVEDKVPPWMKDSGRGWITAEYGLLPCSTATRTGREALKGKVSGRTSEIMRLIGRSLRSVVDMTTFPDRTIILDCDVIQADGGTRTASITGSFVAMIDALYALKQKGIITARPVSSYLAAISCGIWGNDILLDLTYDEDSQAQVDLNLVMTSKGEIVEIQGTAEGNPFTQEQFYKMMEASKAGIKQLIEIQKDALSGVTGIIWPDSLKTSVG